MTTTVLASPRLDSLKAIHRGPDTWPDKYHTLGNIALGWCEKKLLQPDGPKAGEPWRFTDEQVRFILNLYEIDGEGRFTYRSAVYRRMKGAGKNPMAAALCILEFVGPCRFAGFSSDRRPLAQPHHSSWIQTAAVSKEQTRNMMMLFPAMISPALIDEFDIDIGKEIVYANNARCRIEALTSSPAAIEGGRPTFTVKDETQNWLENNEGHAMSRVISRNAAKARGGGARALGICNAHNPGEDSVAERDWEAYVAMEAGKSKATGFLYDSLEAPAEIDLKDHDSLYRGIELARGDSEWLDIERLIQEIWDPRSDPSTSRRYYLNQLVAAEDAWIAPHEWDQLADPKHIIGPGVEITLGFDGSKSNDHSALVGCDVATSHVFTLGVWDPADYGGEIPTELVDNAVNAAFATYLVDGFYSDVEGWESYIDKWEQMHGQGLYVQSGAKHPIAWDMRGRKKEATLLAEATHNAIIEKQLSHEGQKAISQYVYNARRRPNEYGVAVSKEHRLSTRKIDWLMAMMLARKARQDYLALPKERQRRKRTHKAMFA